MEELAQQSRPTGMTGQAPRMYSRPTEPPEPLKPVQMSEEISSLHTKWAALHVGNGAVSRARRRSLGIANRLLGRSDDVLIGDLIRAVATLATRCDELASRTERLETIVADIAGTLGQDVARLQTTVSNLQSSDGER